MFHKIKKVETLDNLMLKIQFIDGIVKLYDVKRLINECQVFCILRNEDLFNKVKVDQGGYGISWNDEIDIECNELWENGEIEKD